MNTNTISVWTIMRIRIFGLNYSNTELFAHLCFAQQDGEMWCQTKKEDTVDTFVIRLLITRKEMKLWNHWKSIFHHKLFFRSANLIMHLWSMSHGIGSLSKHYSIYGWYSPSLHGHSWLAGLISSVQNFLGKLCLPSPASGSQVYMLLLCELASFSLC